MQMRTMHAHRASRATNPGHRPNGNQMNKFRRFLPFGWRSRHSHVCVRARLLLSHLACERERGGEGTAARPLNCNDDMMTTLCTYFHFIQQQQQHQQKQPWTDSDSGVVRASTVSFLVFARVRRDAFYSFSPFFSSFVYLIVLHRHTNADHRSARMPDRITLLGNRGCY